MTYEEFCTVRQRIEKAEALPEEQREKFRGLYSDLCGQAAKYEIENDLLPLHFIQHSGLREAARKLYGVASAGDRIQFVLGIEALLMEVDNDFAMKVFGMKEIKR